MLLTLAGPSSTQCLLFVSGGHDGWFTSNVLVTSEVVGLCDNPTSVQPSFPSALEGATGPSLRTPEGEPLFCNNGECWRYEAPRDRWVEGKEHFFYPLSSL